MGRRNDGGHRERERSLRETALRGALREIALDAGASAGTVGRHALSRDRDRRRRLSKALRTEEAEFVQGITVTAALLQQARDANGEPVYPADARYHLLSALERVGGWPSISALARAQRVSKQAARKQMIAAASRGLLELLPDPRDRRSIQIGLTASGKQTLAAVRARQFNLVARLLTGLEAREMRLVAHVLRVIRERLVAPRGRRG